MLLYQLQLKSDWIERPYFGKNLTKALGKQVSDQSGTYVEGGLQCPVLKNFLENPSGGLFLLAGTRGVGKTTLVRHQVSKWREDEIKRIEKAYSEAKDEQPNDQKTLNLERRLEQARQGYLTQVVDAADLGLFEDEVDSLERVLIIGILRTLQESMIPLEKRATLWGSPAPQRDEPFYRDLVSLVQIASSEKALLQYALAEKNQTGLKAKLELSPAKLADMLGVGIELGKEREWSRARSSQLVWGNSTDALRAELRALFRRHPNQDWPLLVLDEWDRFEDDYDVEPPSASPKKPPPASGEKSESSAETPNAGAPQPEKPQTPARGETKVSLDQALKALSRIKSLLADYPAPVVVVGGEHLYNRVRRNKRGNPEGNCQPESPYVTIFSQQCFISPLPSWSNADKNKPENPLLPYLRGIAIADETDYTEELAHYLLLEIGPNPHALKVFLAHYQDASGHCLKLPRTPDTILKSIMGLTLLYTLAEWEENYAGIIAAGPYQRLCWFRYLRNRMLAYWRSPASRDGRNLSLPKRINVALPHIPNMLLALNENCEVPPLSDEKEEEEAVIHQQLFDHDLYLLWQFHRQFELYAASGAHPGISLEAIPNESKSWSAWAGEDKLIRNISGGAEKGAWKYIVTLDD